MASGSSPVSPGSAAAGLWGSIATFALASIMVAAHAFYELLQKHRRELVDAVRDKPEPQPQEPPRKQTRAEEAMATKEKLHRSRSLFGLDGEKGS